MKLRTLITNNIVDYIPTWQTAWGVHDNYFYIYTRPGQEGYYITSTKGVPDRNDLGPYDSLEVAYIAALIFINSQEKDND